MQQTIRESIPREGGARNGNWLSLSEFLQHLCVSWHHATLHLFAHSPGNEFLA